MVKRLLFDRVNCFTGNSAVNKSIKVPSPVFSDSAETPFFRCNFAPMGTESTVYLIVFKFLVKHRFSYQINPH